MPLLPRWERQPLTAICKKAEELCTLASLVLPGPVLTGQVQQPQPASACSSEALTLQDEAPAPTEEEKPGKKAGEALASVSWNPGRAPPGESEPNVRNRWSREAGGGDRDGGCWNPSRSFLGPRGRAAADPDPALLGESPLLRGAHPPPKPGCVRQRPPHAPGLHSWWCCGSMCDPLCSRWDLRIIDITLHYIMRPTRSDRLHPPRDEADSAGDTSVLGPLFFPILLLYSFQPLPHILHLENSTSILASRKFSLSIFTPTGIPHRMYLCVTEGVFRPVGLVWGGGRV